jgi:hypothetical protein
MWTLYMGVGRLPDEDGDRGFDDCGSQKANGGGENEFGLSCLDKMSSRLAEYQVGQ